MQPVPLLAASARVKRRRLLAPRDSAETAPGAGFARGDESPDEDEDDAPRARSVRAIGAPEVAERPQSSFGGHLRGRSVGDEGGGNDGAANGGAEDGDRGAIAVSRGGGGGSQIARLVARRKQASVLAAADGDGDDAAAFRADLAACADAGDETYAQVPVDQFAKRMLTAMGWRAESAGSAKRAPVKQPRPRPPRLGLGAKPGTQKEVAQKEAERKETVQQGTTPQARGVNGAAMAGVEVAEERHAGKRAAEYCREDDAVEPRNYDRRDDRDDGWRANERRQRRGAGDFERGFKRRDGRRDEGQWDEVAAESRNRDERDVRYDARRADESRRLREADDREQDYRGRGRQGDRTIRDRSRERYMRDDLGGYGDRDRDRQRDGDRYRDRDRHRDRDRERDRDRNRDRDRHRDRDRRYSFRSRSRSPRLR